MEDELKRLRESNAELVAAVVALLNAVGACGLVFSPPGTLEKAAAWDAAFWQAAKAVTKATDS